MATARERVRLGVMVNAPSPYRLYQNQRLAKELPGKGIPRVELTSVFLAGANNQAWSFDAMDSIGAVVLDPSKAATPSSTWRTAVTDTIRGFRAIRAFRRRKIDAAVVFGYSQIESWMVMLWGRLAGVPCFLAGDCNAACDDHVHGLRRWVKSKVVGAAIRLSRAVMPMGRLGRRYFERYGADPGKMFLFPYEADSAISQRVGEDQLALVRAKHGFEEDRRRFVCSGRHVAVKGWDLAIDAFNAIADECPEWDLVMVGDGELRKSLEARVRPDLQDRVIWTGFVKDANELNAIYRSCDVMVHPARYEPWGVVIQEGVAAGLVVIASENTGAAADLVDDLFNGRLVPGEDVDALASAMLDTTTPCILSQMKRAAERQLDQWYEEADAVEGIREALRFAGVIPPRRAKAPRRVQPALATG